MARQIIQAKTARQAALTPIEQAIGQAASNAVSGYQQAQQTARQRAFQERQFQMQEDALLREEERRHQAQRNQAENKALDLSYKTGVNITPEMVQSGGLSGIIAEKGGERLDSSRDYKAQIGEMSLRKEQTALEGQQSKVRRALVKSRNDLDKKYSSFERLYGTIGNLYDKFKENPSALNPQERIQLVRLIVPLSEINPGVVREQEVNMSTSQQTILNRLRSEGEKAFGSGTGLNDVVMSQLFETAATMQPVVAGMKHEDVQNLSDEIDMEGLTQNKETILGRKNTGFLKSGKKGFTGFSYDKKESDSVAPPEGFSPIGQQPLNSPIQNQVIPDARAGSGDVEMLMRRREELLRKKLQTGGNSGAY